MAIQKLLPNYTQSGGYYGIPNRYDINHISTEFLYMEDLRGQFYGLSGGVSVLISSGNTSMSNTDWSYTDLMIPYIRKSISTPDNSTYIYLNKLNFGDTSEDVFKIGLSYDVPNIDISSIKTRFIYSGELYQYNTFKVDYFIFDKSGESQRDLVYYDYHSMQNYTRIGGTYNGDPNTQNILNYSGDTESEFVVFESPEFFVNQNAEEYVNSLVKSGSYIYAEYRIGLKGVTASVMDINSAFSAFELEVSGQVRRESVNLFIDGPAPSSGSITLYTTGNFPTEELTLYTLGAYGYNDNLSLVINGYFPSGNIDLFLKADELPTKSLDLYIQNSLTSGNSNLSLFTQSSIVNSGDFTLYVGGTRYGETNSSINLHMYSRQPSGNLDLFLYNNLQYNNRDLSLYTTSYINESGDIPFYIKGGGIDIRSGNLSLHTISSIEKSGDVSLSIFGNLSSGPINLYISAEDAAKSSGALDFFINSSANSGLYNSFELYVESDVHDANLPLFIPALSTGDSSSSINMVLLNDTTNNKDVLLYVENNLETSTSNYTLFTRGYGSIDGASISNASMNLFMNRSDESVYNTIPMTITGPNGNTSEVSLVISGGTISNGNIELSLPNTVSVNRQGINTYINGF